MTMADILSAVNDARTLLENDDFAGAERVLAGLRPIWSTWSGSACAAGPCSTWPLIWPAPRGRIRESACARNRPADARNIPGPALCEGA